MAQHSGGDDKQQRMDFNFNNGGSGSGTSTASSSSSKGGKKSAVRIEVSRLYDRLPPHAENAERALLGAMILDHHVIGDVLQFVKSRDDFHEQRNGEIFDALRQLYDEKNAGDVAMLYQLLLDRGTAEQVGGADYLEELAASTPVAANAVHYADTVVKKATLRRLIEASAQIMQAAYNDPDDVSEVLDVAEKGIFHIIQHADRREAESLANLLKTTMEVIQSREAGQVITGLASGFRDLDEMTSGLQPGEMIVIAARPSMGKTALALNLAENIALDGHPVGVFSLEMSRQQLAQRLLCSRAEVDSHKLRRNMINKEDYRRLGRAVGELSEAPIMIDDSAGMSLLELRAKARRMALQHGIQFIAIDYLQLLRGSSKESRQQEVAEISRGIKALARELNVPVVCLSQLNRASENREDHRPRMADLRESGAIEQDADVVMMLHREEYFHKEPEWAAENPDKLGVAELIVTKQRNGPTGTIELSWIEEITKFRDHYPSGHGRPRTTQSPTGGHGADHTPGYEAPSRRFEPSSENTSPPSSGDPSSRPPDGSDSPSDSPPPF